ncbi:ion transporter [Leadbetterella sp. DM7]|uniref:ion transporter n=1 Tax=Leadbetterella sp. DM7 TaxID=3235085 RepID=UPI00349EEA4F
MDLFRQKVYIIIYGVNTPAGKAFDIGLLVAILLSVFTIMLETVEGVDYIYHRELVILEWIFTAVFTLEYALRIFVSKKPLKYIFSFYGLIDLLSILPMFLSVFIKGSHILSSFRILRLLRLFRVFGLMEFMRESSRLKVAILASRAKIMVFLYTVLIIAVLIGTLMYYIEGPENGFTNIPKSVFYTIVTLTTVGYGDMVPTTPLGQFLSMLLMIIGYGIIAVPTGIVGVEIAREVGKSMKENYKTDPEHRKLNGIVCAHCNKEGHWDDAEYCYNCGHTLNI